MFERYFNNILFRCQRCGRCCREGNLVVNYGPTILEISNTTKLTPKEIVEMFFEATQSGKYFIGMNQAPCPFLNEFNECDIYPIRPEACRLFPLETDFGGAGICVAWEKLRKYARKMHQLSGYGGLVWSHGWIYKKTLRKFMKWLISSDIWKEERTLRKKLHHISYKETMGRGVEVERRKKKVDELIEILTDGNIGFSLRNCLREPPPPRYEGWPLIYSIFYGALAQLAYKLIDHDALVSQMLRKRTEICLDSVGDMRKAIKWLKNFILQLEANGERIPKLLKRYTKGKKSFTNYILDMKVSLDEIKEMLNFLLNPRIVHFT